LYNQINNFHNNTTNLKEHLKRKDPLQLEEFEIRTRTQQGNQLSHENNGVAIGGGASGRSGCGGGSNNRIATTTNDETPAPSKKQRQLGPYTRSQNEVDIDSFDRAVLKMITEDYQPLSLVENKGFIQLIKTLQPDFNLPSRKKKILKVYCNKNI
jgi:hypothetical protein